MNRFFKVGASDWESPELSETCEVWGISAEKLNIPKGSDSTETVFYFHRVCVRTRVCKDNKKKPDFLSETYWVSLSKDTRNKREDVARITGGEGKNK